MNYNGFGDDGVEILDLGSEQIRSILTVIFDPENHDTQLEDSVLEVIAANGSVQWINLIDEVAKLKLLGHVQCVDDEEAVAALA